MLGPEVHMTTRTLAAFFTALLLPAAATPTDPPKKPATERRSQTATQAPGGAKGLPQAREGDRNQAEQASKAAKEAQGAATGSLLPNAGGTAENSSEKQSQKREITDPAGKSTGTGLPEGDP
jgi:hypothetical protein